MSKSIMLLPIDLRDAEGLAVFLWLDKGMNMSP
jgi:hypothetical protein